MPLLSFNNLSNKFGEIIAYQYLTEIEKAAHIRPSSMTGIAPEIRLANAIRAQDALWESAVLAAA